MIRQQTADVMQVHYIHIIFPMKMKRNHLFLDFPKKEKLSFSILGNYQGINVF